jgi:hypothetical protein
MTGGFRVFGGAFLFLCMLAMPFGTSAQVPSARDTAEEALREELSRMLQKQGISPVTRLWFDEQLRFLGREDSSSLPMQGLFIRHLQLLPMKKDSANSPESFLLSLEGVSLGSSGLARMFTMQDTIHLPSAPRSARVDALILSADSFWSSVLQPILVTVGAAVVIALFFFVRS